MMRIVGGKYRHRLIKWSGDMATTRPTKDRIREAIFSALGNIEGFNALDLYAGSGAMGLEALSRGCKKASFVDSSKEAIRIIKDNLVSLSINENEYSLFNNKDIEAIDLFNKNNECFDLIFLDPPYIDEGFLNIINLLFNKDLLSKEAIIVVETNKIQDFSNYQFSKIKEYKYGEIRVYILRR